MAEEEARERSTTTGLIWPEAVAADLDGAERWLYFIKGTGNNRDMRLALGVLKAWLQTDFGDITAEDITAESLNVVGNNASAKLTETLLKMITSGSKDMQMTVNGVTFTDDSGTHAVSATFGRTGITLTNNDGKSLTISYSGGVTVTDGGTSATFTKDGASKAALATEAAGYTQDGVIATELAKKMQPSDNNNAGPTAGVYTAMASLPICIMWLSDSSESDVGNIISTYVNTTYKTARANSGPSMYVIVNADTSGRQMSGFKQGSSTIAVTVPAEASIIVVRNGQDYYAPGYYAA